MARGLLPSSAMSATPLLTGRFARRTAAALCVSFGLFMVARTGFVGHAQTTPTLPNPVLFVTQVPVPQDFTTIGSLFGNHRGSYNSASRGGDLWIRYGNGTLKNLTQTAGYGVNGLQSTNSIAVREPSVHWSGTKALFSMVIGGATRQYELTTHYWQIYEITGLGASDTPVITKVANQPLNYNNVSPIYGTDDRIIFTSDRARDGQRHLSPQRDEYEVAPVVTGLYSLDPATGDLFLMQQSPSGSFSPQVDSFGRVVYVRWDHLQRDQLADADETSNAGYGTFNYTDESATATRLNVRTELFPEPRGSRTDLLAGTNMNGHTFNDFFPWMINEDGTSEETVNHLGRHEFHGYFDVSFNDDANLIYHSTGTPRTNPNVIDNFIHIKEDPTVPGTYYGIDAPEFSTHSSGQVVKFNAPVGLNPDQSVVTYVTHRDTHTYTDTPSVNHTGLYRNPLPLSNGQVVVTHTTSTRADTNIGTTAAPLSRYDFRLKLLVGVGINIYGPGPALTPGITKSVSWWDPDTLVSYSGPLWELDAVEVRARTRPARATTPLPPSVQQVFAQQGINMAELTAFMKSNNLALIVSNNVTTRDRNDKQQPYNLRVAGTQTQTLGAGGRVYDVSHLQIFQADQLRGIGGINSPQPGRRVLAQYLHDPSVRNPPVPGAPTGSVVVGPDGSTAAFVPARRALSWQLTAPNGTPVVRERYWLTMQPGEVRVCGSCHGVNTADQAGRAAPVNQPEALRQLMAFYREEMLPPSAPRNVRIRRY